MEKLWANFWPLVTKQGSMENWFDIMNDRDTKWLNM
jgi:hypothetical protein